MNKILVIEDAEPLRNDIIEMLNYEGFQVMGAENGRIGIDMARANNPDLIICDIMMPEINGYGVLDELRQDIETVAIPFIFLTAKTDRTDVRYGMGLGADDYLTKPFVASELLETINARLEKRKTYADLTETKLKELSDNIITALPHELRTPLNTIIGFSDMLIMEAQRLSPEQISEWSLHINLAAQRLYRLVENHLMYVRAEIISHSHNEMTMLREKYVEHPDTILQFHAMHKAQQIGRQDDLKMDVEDSVSVQITDHDLGKIIEELVDNALKFSDPGKIVTVKTDIEGDYYVIRVQDQGRGMTPEQIEDIRPLKQFERVFYEHQGNGLGLIITKRLIEELYDGQFKIESEVQKGTCVSVYLKLAVE